MAAITEGLGHVVDGFVEQAGGIAREFNNPISTNLSAPQGERLRIFGYLIGERRSSGLTLVKACGAELLGTGLFVFMATGVVTSGCHTESVVQQSGNGGDTQLYGAKTGSCFLNDTSTLLNIALAFGFTLFSIIYFTASFSGGHINPAVSLAMFLNKRISLLRCVLYIIMQCCGAALGSVVLKGCDPSGYNAAAGATNTVNHSTGTTVGTALAFEIILTFALVFTVFAATDSGRALSTAPLPILAPFSIGMVVFVCHLIAIPIDGTSINPARSFGPALVAREFRYQWIFWVGPFVGAILGSTMYELAFKTKKKGRSKQTSSDAQLREDIESGIPIASNAQKAVHAGTAGLEETNFTEDDS